MVQHAHGGTYVGILDVDGTILNIPVSCTGASVLVVDRYGDEATGDGDCVVSVLGLGEIPLHYVFELDIDGTGAVSGTAAADLLGWFQYNFPASGTLVPDGAGFDLVFEGSVPLMGPLNGATDAVRVSLDSE